MGNAVVEELHDVGVLDVREEFGLLEKFLPEDRILAARVHEPLDGNDASLTLVFGQVNVGHCALAEGVENQVTVPDDAVEVRGAVHIKCRCFDAISDNRQLCGRLGAHELSR